ncbi:MAG: hypothetical protein Q7R87_04555 [Nanoarchaeota archaeon]|nr:hypothetical protein [Nanoarchaeota archaeon]
MAKNKAFPRRNFLLGTAAAILGYAGFRAYQHRPVSTAEIATFKGVEKIVSQNGEVPEVIVLLQSHPNQDVNITGKDESSSSIDAVSGICNKLYQRGVRSLLIEGLDNHAREVYNKSGKLKFKKGTTQASYHYFGELEKLLNRNKWELHNAESPEIDSKVDEVRKQLQNKHEVILAETDNSIKYLFSPYRRKTISVSESNMLRGQYKRTIDIANDKIRNATTNFFTPERFNYLYDLEVTQRDVLFGQASKKAKEDKKTPIIMIYGIAHQFSIPKNLQGMSYALVRPSGIDREPMPSSRESYIERHNFNLKEEDWNLILARKQITASK